ncbi:MAG: class C sortase [Ruminococcus sp.]|nr:class C sortase [Ruminococcus sp.]
MKQFIAVIVFIVLLTVGVGIIGYPFVSNYLMSQNLDSEVQSYLSSASQMSKDQYSEEIKKAKEYNKSLIGNVEIADPFGDEPKGDDNYNELLNVDGTSVMAVIEIPAIDIRYPVYHSANDDVLDRGIGHLRNTSLPIGGKGTHSVLTGHTGHSQAKFFTDLEKVETGDVFYISVLNETLAYKVDQIKVVLPSDTSQLQIDTEKDYVTLVTCTPFGVNSHRLLVRGSRIPYNEEIKEKFKSVKIEKSTWVDEYMYAIIIGASVMFGILIVYAVVRVIRKQAEKRKEND